jgi:hypothetical protein
MLQLNRILIRLTYVLAIAIFCGGASYGQEQDAATARLKVLSESLDEGSIVLPRIRTRH